jgi:hypothetical protein
VKDEILYLLQIDKWIVFIFIVVGQIITDDDVAIELVDVLHKLDDVAVKFILALEFGFILQHDVDHLLVIV